MADSFTLADASGNYGRAEEMPTLTPPLPTAAEILVKLASTDVDQSFVRRLVIEAEGVSFSDEQKPYLCTALSAFIERRRDSQDPEDLVAVGAAVRKLIAVIPPDGIPLLSLLLDAGHRAAVPLEIELEITKMVAWKLSLAPPGPGTMPELADRLLDLARLYLHDRLLPRKGYAAVALNAVLVLFLLRFHVDEITESLLRLHSSWFKELVVRRLTSLKDDLHRRFPANDFGDLIAVLQHAITALSVARAA